MYISDIMHTNPKTIHQDATVEEAVKELLTDLFNGFIVLDDQKQVVGILSLQDIAAATIPEQFKNNIGMANAMYRHGFFRERCEEIKNKKVKELMRTDTIQADLTTNIMAITADFLKNDLYIVPVFDKGVLVGVVTRTEIKHALARGMHLE